jgi:membrane associated rhomboid family serine protease
LFWSGTEPQTILLSVFVHFDLMHLAFNCVALYLFGNILEEKHGARLLTAVFVACGTLGNLAFASVNPTQAAALLGASGGVMGTIGALARLSPHERITILGIGVILPNVRIWVAALVFATIDLALAIAAGFASVSLFGIGARVAYVAHLGGLAAGLLLAPLLVRLKNPMLVREVDGSSVERLVAGEVGKQIAGAVKGETDPEIIATWMKRIEEVGKCPECAGPLRGKGGGRFRCEKGHAHRVGR